MSANSTNYPWGSDPSNRLSSTLESLSRENLGQTNYSVDRLSLSDDFSSGRLSSRSTDGERADRTALLPSASNVDAPVEQTGVLDTASTVVSLSTETLVSALTTNYVTISQLSFSGLEGDAGTFQLQLSQAPTSNVTVTLSPGSFLSVDADGNSSNGSQTTITFTPQDWSQSRTVQFIAENDSSSSNRTQGNTIAYSLTGGLVDSGTYNLGSITNTYAPDTTRFNIDLDFRNDSSGFWTPARRAAAQQAANDWAARIQNEWTGLQLSNTIGRLESNGTRPYSFTANRYVDDLVIFVNSSSSGGTGMGGPDYEFGGWATTPNELMPRVGQLALDITTFGNQPTSVIYQAVSHEIGHVLGLVGLNWAGYLQEVLSSAQTAVFAGEYARAANGGNNIPLRSQDGVNDYSHPAASVQSIMSYGWTYSLSGPSNIDFAMLADSGYRIQGINESASATSVDTTVTAELSLAAAAPPPVGSCSCPFCSGQWAINRLGETSLSQAIGLS